MCSGSCRWATMGMHECVGRCCTGHAGLVRAYSSRHAMLCLIAHINITMVVSSLAVSARATLDGNCFTFCNMHIHPSDRHASLLSPKLWQFQYFTLSTLLDGINMTPCIQLLCLTRSGNNQASCHVTSPLVATWYCSC